MKKIVLIMAGFLLFLASCSAPDYKPGDIYSVDIGEAKFRAAQIRDIKGDTLLVHLYSTPFDSRPGAEDLRNIDAAEKDDAVMPLTKEFFKEWEPELIKNEPLRVK